MLQDVEKAEEAAEKYAAGEEPAEAELQDLQKTMELVSFNPYIRDLLDAELSFSKMMAEIWEIIGEALGLEPPEAQPTEQEPEPRASEASSRLWVPRKGFLGAVHQPDRRKHPGAKRRSTNGTGIH